MAPDTPRPMSGRARSSPLPHRWERVERPGDEGVVAAYPTVIAGAGPAGLTAAYELTKHGQRCVVLEADPNLVGGISRTDQYQAPTWVYDEALFEPGPAQVFGLLITRNGGKVSDVRCLLFGGT